MKSEKLRKLWKERVEAYRKSELSGKKWCQENNLKHDRLRYWITKFNKENKSDTQHAIGENSEYHKGKITETEVDTGKWVTIENINNIQNMESEEQIVIKIDKANIVIPNHFNLETLSNVMKVFGVLND